jgi:hypothetical protein
MRLLPIVPDAKGMIRRLTLALLVVGAALALVLPATAAGPPVKVLSVTRVVAKNQQATLVAKAPSGVTCNLVIYLRSGPSAANGLGPKRATNGRVTWTWTVSRSTTGGTWPIYVECGRNGIAGIAKTSFTIV